MRSRRKNKSTSSIKYLKIKSKDFSFEFSKISTLLFLILLVFILIHSVIYISFRPKKRRITNLSKTYILSVESWNAYYTLHTAVIETLFYNNTFKMWDGKLSTYDFYFKHKEFTKRYILDNFTESLEFDLGNYTEKYRGDLSTVIFQ